jgi:hypothetical protein
MAEGLVWGQPLGALSPIIKIIADTPQPDPCPVPQAQPASAMPKVARSKKGRGFNSGQYDATLAGGRTALCCPATVLQPLCAKGHLLLCCMRNAPTPVPLPHDGRHCLCSLTADETLDVHVLLDPHSAPLQPGQ